MALRSLSTNQDMTLTLLANQAGANAALIAANTAAIGVNAGDIATNAGDITTNAGAIATNATNITDNDGDIADILTTIGTMDGDVIVDIVAALEPFLADGSITNLFEQVATYMQNNPVTVVRDVTHGIVGLTANTTYLVYRSNIPANNITLSDNDANPAAGQAGGVEAIMHVGADNTLGDVHYGSVVVIPSHGFALGETYFVGEDGIPTPTLPTNATDIFLQPAFVVWDANTLLRVTQLPQAL
jgi:hypothetical protein